MDKHWGRWEQFCLENNVDPYLQTWDDPVPIIQVFGERYRDGRLAPKQNSVKSRTVEDAICAVGQAHARLVAPDPLKDHHGKIDFRIQRQIKAYEKSDDPPRRVKPVPMLVTLYILEQEYGDSRTLANTAIADMICIAVFFLLRPGEYTGTTVGDTPFRLEDVGVYIRDRNLDIALGSDAEPRLRHLCLLHLHDAKERNSRQKTGPRQKWECVMLPSMSHNPPCETSSITQVRPAHSNSVLL
jgi:hypothetical protein